MLTVVGSGAGDRGWLNNVCSVDIETAMYLCSLYELAVHTAAWTCVGYTVSAMSTSWCSPAKHCRQVCFALDFLCFLKIPELCQLVRLQVTGLLVSGSSATASSDDGHGAVWWGALCFFEHIRTGKWDVNSFSALFLTWLLCCCFIDLNLSYSSHAACFANRRWPVCVCVINHIGSSYVESQEPLSLCLQSLNWILKACPSSCYWNLAWRVSCWRWCVLA